MKPPFWIVLSLALSFVLRAEEGARSAARLLPPETFVFMELHDLPRTAARFKDTCWAELAREPEVQDFYKKLISATEQNTPTEVRSTLDAIAKVRVADAFFALTEMPEPAVKRIPKMIGGVSYRGEAQHAQALLQKLRDALLTDAKVKSSKETVEGNEVETFSDGNFSLSIVHADQWVILATDLQLMREALARKAGRGTASLVETDAWKAATKEAVAEPDMTAFLLYEAMMKKLMDAGGAETAALGVLRDFLPQFISVSTKLDGRLMRERAYAHFKMVLPRGESKHRSLAFTGEDTFAYLESDMASTAMAVEKFAEVTPELKESGELAQYGLSFADITKTFGPEIALVSDWESGALAFPTLFASVELRDAEKGRKFAGLITGAMASGGEVIRKDYHGTMLWSVKATMPILQPTLAVTDTHLMFGLNQSSITAALDHAKAGKSSIAGSAPFTDALKTVANTNDGLAYVDCRRLTERLYERARPFIANAIASKPELAKYFDGSLLPKVETVARHMPPFVAGFHAGEHGYIIESTGPLTYLTGVGGVAFIVGFTIPVMTAAKMRAVQKPHAEEKTQ